MGTVAVTINISGKIVTIDGIRSDDDKLAKLIAHSTEATVSLAVRSSLETASLVGQLQYYTGVEVLAPRPVINEMTDDHIRALSMTTREYLRNRIIGEKATITRLINVLSDDVKRLNDYAKSHNEPQIEQLEYIWQVCEETDVNLRKRRIADKSVHILEVALRQTDLRLGMKGEIAKIKDRLPKHNP